MHEGRDDVTYHHVHAHVNDRVGERRWKERRGELGQSEKRREGDEEENGWTDGGWKDGKTDRQRDGDA